MYIGPKIETSGLVLNLDAANEKSFRGEPTTNMFTHYGSPGIGSSGDVPVTFNVQGTGTFIRLGSDQIYGGYRIKSDDVVYRYNLGTSGCHYHGNTISVPSGTYLTFSFEYYITPETTLENTLLAAFEGINVTRYFSESVKGSWKKVIFTMGPTSSAGNVNLFLYPGGCSSSRLGNTGYILYKNPQVELKPYATPFVNGTRGTTVATGGGWADRSGNNNHGELVNGVTYNSNNLGSLVFDGVNDRVSTNQFTYTPRSISIWFYNNSIIPGNDIAIGGPSTFQCLFSFGGGTAGVNLGEWTGSATNEAVHIWSVASGARLTYTNQSIPIGIHNFIFNWIGSRYDIWIDGIKQNVIAGGNGHSELITYNNSIILGSDNNTYNFWGNIYSFCMYNSSLTDNQILQNFNATRKRYGI